MNKGFVFILLNEMMYMERIRKYGVAVLMIISFLMSMHISNAQIVAKDTIDRDREVFWFYVRINEGEDDSIKHAIYIKESEKSKIDSGSLKEFDRTLWKLVNSSTCLSIGTFNNLNEVKNALQFYHTNRKSSNIDTAFYNNKEIFWFKISLSRNRESIIPLRPRGSIEYGNYKDFETAIRNNLMMGLVTIGPFLKIEDAEFAMRFYRLY
jgi:hypothetical protein